VGSSVLSLPNPDLAGVICNADMRGTIDARWFMSVRCLLKCIAERLICEDMARSWPRDDKSLKTYYTPSKPIVIRGMEIDNSDIDSLLNDDGKSIEKIFPFNVDIIVPSKGDIAGGHT
jgi:hypothetical protein